MEALRCYTAESAYAELSEDRKGTIEVGKLADLAVLSEDITAVDPSKIQDVRVDRTIVDGVTVWARAPKYAGAL
jgi:hypothetical protein